MSENIAVSQSKTLNPTARQANLELLRCVAMMMVIVLHYLGKGNLLVSLEEPRLYPAEFIAWLLESFCIVAVNVYMFISGYFLCTSCFKPSRLFKLWLQVCMYSLVFGLIGAFTGIIEEIAVDTHFFLTLIFPVSMGHYWFMTAYIILYMLLPLLGMAVKKMRKRQLQITVFLLLFAFSLTKSVLPVRLDMDVRGYDCLWYICVFVVAAYVRRFGVSFLEKRGSGLALYLGCCMLIFCETMILREMYLRTGSLSLMLTVCMDYNHILPLLAAVGLFGAFCRLKISGRFAAFVCRISPYTLGVYLLHENLGLRYTWPNWLGADRLLEIMPFQPDISAAERLGLGDSLVRLLLFTLGAAVCVFVVGILTDMLRDLLMRGLDRGLNALSPYRRLRGWVLGLDRIFRVDVE